MKFVENKLLTYLILSSSTKKLKYDQMIDTIRYVQYSSHNRTIKEVQWLRKRGTRTVTARVLVEVASVQRKAHNAVCA